MARYILLFKFPSSTMLVGVMMENFLSLPKQFHLWPRTAAWGLGRCPAVFVLGGRWAEGGRWSWCEEKNWIQSSVLEYLWNKGWLHYSGCHSYLPSVRLLWVEQNRMATMSPLENTRLLWVRHTRWWWHSRLIPGPLSLSLGPTILLHVLQPFSFLCKSNIKFCFSHPCDYEGMGTGLGTPRPNYSDTRRNW